MVVFTPDIRVFRRLPKPGDGAVEVSSLTIYRETYDVDFLDGILPTNVYLDALNESLNFNDKYLVVVELENWF